MTEQRLDAHYQGFTEDGNRLHVTAYGVPAPAQQTWDWDGKDVPIHMELVGAHTSWGRPDRPDNEREHTWRTGCFPYDPKFDDDEPDCPNDSDGDGDCRLCVRRPGGCFHRHA